MALHLKYRPATLAEVSGQGRAVATLQAKLAADDVPRVVLFEGPTGTGKTTLARILAREVGCTDPHEINCGHVRGIDSVREIEDLCRFKSLGGGPRAFILDEVVQLPKLTQQAFLKVLEDVPSHVYFFLCTTTTTGLLPTFKGRCFPVGLGPLSREEITLVLRRALAGEGRTVSGEVTRVLARAAEGSARRALQALEVVLATTSEGDQLALLAGFVPEDDAGGGLLGKVLVYGGSWEKAAAVLAAADDSQVEGLRRQALAYACKVLLGKADKEARSRANAVIKALQFSFAEGGTAALASACFSCFFRG